MNNVTDISVVEDISIKAVTNKIRSTALHLAACLNAQTCHSLERSIKTLALWVERQNSNAQEIAEYLHSHAAVSKVYYPGFKDHPKHHIALKQMVGLGGMVSFETVGIS